MDLPLSTNLLTYALKKENEDLAFSMWKSLYPYMEIGQIKFLNFNDYKKELFKPRVKMTKKTSEEIMAEMQLVISQHEGR